MGVGRWPNTQRLQHPERKHAPPCTTAEGRSQEEEEEAVHHTQEEQAQEEDEAARPQVLQSRRARKGHATQEGVSRGGLRSWRFHGLPSRPAILWQMRTYVCVSEAIMNFSSFYLL